MSRLVRGAQAHLLQSFSGHGAHARLMIASSPTAASWRTSSQLGLEKSEEAASSTAMALPARLGLNPLLQKLSVLEIVDIRYLRLDLRLGLVERE